MPVVISAGVPIHYEVIGAGPPIVLVHGFASSLEGSGVKPAGRTFWSVEVAR
jgi:pimeloyl-ACP methyl ester carboxylesterase